MSYLRSGHPLIFFKGFSKSYVFLSSAPGQKDYVEDYDDKYDDNATFADLLVNFVLRESNDENYAWKIAGILEKKFPDIKRRAKPLNADEYSDLMNEELERFKREEGKELFDLFNNLKSA